MKKYDKFLEIDGKDFLIIETLENEGKKYLYVINENEDEIAYLEEYVSDGETMVRSVSDEEFDKIAALFAEKIVNDINAN